MLCAYLIVLPSVGICNGFGGGSFHIVNHSSDKLYLATMKTNCASAVKYMNLYDKHNGVLNVGTESTLHFDYSIACGEMGGYGISRVVFTLLDADGVIATFAASIGSLQAPEKSYYHAYTVKKESYCIEKVNSDTFSVSMKDK